jgi:hypothetical protein
VIEELVPDWSPSSPNPHVCTDDTSSRASGEDPFHATRRAPAPRSSIPA